MTSHLPDGGLPIRLALPLVIDGPLRAMLEPFLMTVPNSGNKAMLDNQLQILWSEICRKVLWGELTLTGFLPGDRKPRPVEPGLLKHSKPDIEADALTTNIGIFSGILICPAPLASAPLTPAPDNTPGEPIPAMTSNDAGASDRTGAPGAPSSMHLVTIELQRRAAAGEMITTSLKTEAEHLAGLMRTKFPGFQQPTSKTIQNQLGTLYLQLKRSQN